MSEREGCLKVIDKFYKQSNIILEAEMKAESCRRCISCRERCFAVAEADGDVGRALLSRSELSSASSAKGTILKLRLKSSSVSSFFFTHSIDAVCMEKNLLMLTAAPLTAPVSRTISMSH